MFGVFKFFFHVYETGKHLRQSAPSPRGVRNLVIVVGGMFHFGLGGYSVLSVALCAGLCLIIVFFAMVFLGAWKEQRREERKMKASVRNLRSQVLSGSSSLLVGGDDVKEK